MSARGSHHNHPRRPAPFTWFVIFFTVTFIAIMALIPVTGGKSLMMVIPWFLLLLVCGFCYVMFSSTKPDH